MSGFEVDYFAGITPSRARYAVIVVEESESPNLRVKGPSLAGLVDLRLKDFPG